MLTFDNCCCLSLPGATSGTERPSVIPGGGGRGGAFAGRDETSEIVCRSRTKKYII